MWTVGVLQHNGNELHVHRAGIVGVLVDQITFPPHTVPDAGCLGTHYPSTIRLRAHHKDVPTGVDLPIRPARPSLGRRVLVLVENAVDAVLSQAIRQLSNSGDVFGSVVAVTHEHFVLLGHALLQTRRPRKSTGIGLTPAMARTDRRA